MKMLFKIIAALCLIVVGIFSGVSAFVGGFLGGNILALFFFATILILTIWLWKKLFKKN